MSAGAARRAYAALLAAALLRGATGQAADPVVARVQADTQLLHPALVTWFASVGARPPLHRQAPLTSRQGAAFAAGEGLAVTAAHVVVGATRLTVDAPGPVGARVVAVDLAHDLALLDVDLGPAAARRAPSVGERVRARGFPGGSADGVGVEGTVLGAFEGGQAGGPGTVWSTDLIVVPGFSGAPLLAEGGTVVGVVTSGRRSAGRDEGPALAAHVSAVDALRPTEGPLLVEDGDAWRVLAPVWGPPVDARVTGDGDALRRGRAAVAQWGGRSWVVFAGAVVSPRPRAPEAAPAR